MRILLVTPSYFPIVGGSETLTRILSVKLNENGIHADIMTFNMDTKWHPRWKEETIKDDQINVFRAPAFNPLPKLPNPLFNLFRINVFPKPNFTRKLREYDIVHFVGEADLSFPFFSYFVEKPKLLQCVAIFKNGGIYKYYMNDRIFFGKVFTRLFSNLADKFVISTTEERELLSEMGIPKSKIVTIPIGVDTEVFLPNQKKKSDNLVLFVGRISRIKGLHILMEALAYVDIPIQLAIIGPKWEAKYAKEIEEMASVINEKGVHKVIFLGELDHKDLVPWYQKASLVICPFLYETFSNVVRESLACGTPVVSTGSHIEDGSDGILLTSKNPRDIADSIKKMLKDRKMREKYGEDGRKSVKNRFSWDSIIRTLTKVYEDLSCSHSDNDVNWQGL